MLRVVVDGLGYLGVVESTPSTTLASLRSTLSLTFDVDSLPRHFSFLGSHGSTLGTRLESTVLASSLGPTVTLLPTTESPVAGASAFPRQKSRATLSLTARGVRCSSRSPPRCTARFCASPHPPTLSPLPPKSPFSLVGHFPSCFFCKM